MLKRAIYCGWNEMSSVMMYHVLQDFFFFSEKGKSAMFSLLMIQGSKWITFLSKFTGHLLQHSIAGKNKLWTN